MNALKTILRECVGLFVDDVGFATAIVGWITLAWLLSAYVLPPSPWVAILLFAGLGAILLESALRRTGATR
jgi:putative Mn2+ efflux pump MntP